MSKAHARWKKDLAAGAAFFVFALAFSMSWGWDLSDDSWLVQIANRIVNGEALYRDVYLHVTPLSVYLLALPTAVLGAEIMWLKLELALVFAGMMLVALHINEQLGGRRYSPLLIAGLLAFASPARMQLIAYYSHLTNFFLMAAFAAWLSWRAKLDNRLMYVTGVMLALSFVSKQNTGAYGVAALIIAETARAVACGDGVSIAIRSLLRAAMSFVIAVIVLLSPVFLTGGLAELIDQGFLGHDAYMAFGGIRFMKPIFSLIHISNNPASLDTLRAISAALPYLLPFATGPLLLIVFLRGDTKDHALPLGVAAFSAAGLGIVYPRADPQHMIFAVPLLLLTLGYCARRLTRYATSTWTVLRFAGISVSAGALLFMTWTASQRVRPEVGVISSLPHFEGPILPRYLHVPLAGNISKIPMFPRDGKTFFVGPHASLYYLAGEIRNPTKYDYPTIVALRAIGTQEVKQLISDGRIQRVCIGPGNEDILEPQELKQWIKRTMVRLPYPDFCEQYTRRDSSSLISSR